MVLILISLFLSSASAQDPIHRFVQIEAKTKEQRSQIANLGVTIEAVRSDSIWGFADPLSLMRVKESGIKVLGDFSFETARGGHQTGFDFPGGDSKFHNYDELVSALRGLKSKHADITQLISIGKSVEGRDLWAFHINTTPGSLQNNTSTKPGIIFMGTHHAREHVSTEIPVMLIKHLLDNRADPKIWALLDSRDIWIIPMVNPDGVEWDISSTGNYKMWRKNRKANKGGTSGVDLNRNYGFKWGTGGSSNDPSNDTYMGQAPFSEPETSAIRDFVDAHLNAKILLSFHTFSELILYPWGNTYDDIGNARDLATYKKMATTMSAWNGYTPQQSSELYIASGDTTDWSYGTHGIFSFTFELSPKSMWDGGFYPGQGVLDKVFQDNLRPLMYLIDLANDPYRVLDEHPNGWLKNYVLPQVPTRYSPTY